MHSHYLAMLLTFFASVGPTSCWLLGDDVYKNVALDFPPSSTAMAHFLGHKYRILGHSLLFSIYDSKNGFGKNMACL